MQEILLATKKCLLISLSINHALSTLVPNTLGVNAANINLHNVIVVVHSLLTLHQQ